MSSLSAINEKEKLESSRVEEKVGGNSVELPDNVENIFTNPMLKR